MRILQVTDTHLGAVRAVRGAPRGWRRADDHLDALRAALRKGEELGVDAVLHSGDLFDRSRPPTREVLRAEALLREAARWARVVVVPGNHDRRGLARWLPHPSIEVHDRPAPVRIGDVRLGLVPFRRRAEDFAAAARSVGEVDLLVAHQAFHGARVPGLVFREGGQADTIGERHLPPAVRWVACGHLHPRQVVELGGASIVQPGSTERTSWSERDQVKGVALWDFAAVRPWTFLDLPSRPMVEVARPDDLGQVLPGALVRVAGVPEEEVLARGGWLDGSGFERTSAPPIAAEPDQLSLYPTVRRSQRSASVAAGADHA